MLKGHYIDIFIVAIEGADQVCCTEETVGTICKRELLEILESRKVGEIVPVILKAEFRHVVDWAGAEEIAGMGREDDGVLIRKAGKAARK